MRLGAPGVVHRVVVDTRHFTGNHPARYLVEAAAVPGHPSPAELAAAPWQLLVPETVCAAAGPATHDVGSPRRWTHVRLTIDPDGGVARLRVLGRPVPDPALFDGVTVDLLARGLGGVVTSFSDAFYTHPEVLTRPDLPRTMGEGWEARRRRDGGHDWVVLRLAVPGVPRAVEVDTSYYVYNASSEVALWGLAAAARRADPEPDDDGWLPLLPRTALQPDTRHRWPLKLPEGVDGIGWVRLDAHPDAGLARLRLPGVPSEAGWLVLRSAWSATAG